MALNLPPWDPQDVIGARDGDRQAWQRLARTWGPMVLRWCGYLGGPRVDREDAAQQVFVVVWRKLDSLRDPQRFPSWLFGITRRVLSDQRRSAWMRRWLPGAPIDREVSCYSPERQAAQSELAQRVEQALERLSANHREILILCDLQEFTVVEAATMLGIRLNTGKSRLIRARAKFAAAAEQLGLDSSSVRERVGIAPAGIPLPAAERQP